MPTKRGAGLALTAAVTYLVGRLIGTWELYLAALTLGALVLLSLSAVRLAGGRMRARRTFEPEEPAAGSRPLYRAEISNDSWLPTPALHIREALGSATGMDVGADLSPVTPHSSRAYSRELPPLRRGAHDLGRLEVDLTDPLGLARRSVSLGDPLSLTVPPRIAGLTSLAFFGRTGLGELTRARLARSHASTDIRGVRPHQPGEPLNRIDWKSTARTGTLMLRETEEPTRTDVVVALDGTRAANLGEPPDTSFEAAVAAAGSIGDYVLREGLAVTFLFHGATDGPETDRFDGRARGSRQMLERLAAVTPEAESALGDTLSRQEEVLGRGAAVIVISASGGRTLQTTLIDLADRRIPVFLVYVDAMSFAGYDPDLDRAQGGGPATGPDVERRRVLLGLAAGGVPSVVLRRGDDLATVLSLPTARRASASGAESAVEGIV